MQRRFLCSAVVLLACSSVMAQVVPANPTIPAPTAEARSQFLQQNPATGFTEIGTLIERVWGRAFSSGLTPIDSVQAFVNTSAGIYGVTSDQLVLGGPFEDGRSTTPIMYDEATDRFIFTGVYYTQVFHGVPVFRGHLVGLVRNEPGFPMVLAGSTLRDVSSLEGQLAGQALGAMNPAIYTRYALNQFRAPPRVSEPRWVIWAGIDDETPEPRLAIEFDAEGGSHLDPDNHMHMLYVVDAADGRILYQESLIYFADVSGSVRAQVSSGNKADICTGVIDVSLPYAKITSPAGTHFADVDGNFLVPWPSSGSINLTSAIVGAYFAVNSSTTANLSLTATVPSGGSITFLHNGLNSSSEDRAQVNAYLHANIARDLILRANPQFPSIATQSEFPVIVNISNSCNAFYQNSTINFYLAGGGCPNTAFSTVVHHEFGHNMVAKGGSGQGAYGEGMSDCLAILVTDESVLAFGFQGNCNSGLRDANNNCQYQTSGCSSCGSAIHACGRLLSGCIWDLRNNFLAAYPADYRDRIAVLTVNSVLLRAGLSSITPSITVDFLTLNDDNADITDGTPDYDLINLAFSLHNMPGPTLAPIKFSFPSGLPTLAAPNGSTSIPVQVQALSGSPVPGTGVLFYRFGNSGAFTSAPMTQAAANQYTASIPAGPCGTTLQYYFSAQAVGGGVVTSPGAAPSAFYSAPVAFTQSVIWDDDFESDKGWTYGVAGDTATSGFWERGNPIGTTAQPNGGHQPEVSGPNCAFTGQHPGGGAGANDVDNGITTLISPVFGTGGADDIYFTAFVWYSNDKGANPGVDVMPVHVSNNGGATWTLITNINNSTTSWVPYSWRLADYVPLTENMRVRFRAQDLGAQALVEAAVDTVAIVGYGCTPVVPGDLNGDGVVNGADIALLLGNWGGSGTGDLNGDGTVDGSDLAILLGNWS
ncbi:MAG: hypothetical protein KF724_01895 [Phycisphaeraceae bacterium]|nr:hypothetical protein [Phycisphaeraceae bacterium]